MERLWEDPAVQLTYARYCTGIFRNPKISLEKIQFNTDGSTMRICWVD
jgi:hypothetical protein